MAGRSNFSLLSLLIPLLAACAGAIEQNSAVGSKELFRQGSQSWNLLERNELLTVALKAHQSDDELSTEDLETLHLLRGVIHLHYGRNRLAIEELSRPVEARWARTGKREPLMSGQILHSRAQGYARIGEFERALADMNVVLDSFPERLDYLAFRINLNATLKKHEEVIRDVKVIKENRVRRANRGELITANMAEAYALQALDRETEALHSVESAIGMHPNRPQPAGELAALKASILSTANDRSLRDGKKAVVAAKQAIGWDDRPQFHDVLATAYLEVGDRETALKEYLYVVGTGDKKLIKNYQKILFERGNFTGALDGNSTPELLEAITHCVRAGCDLRQNK